MESDYSYLKEQERTWDSLGFNKFMVRTTVSDNDNAMSSDDFNAMMQGGSMNSSMMVLDFLNKAKGIRIGQEDKIMQVDETGMWLGAKTFATAPFSVDMSGNVVASSASFSAYATTAAALLKTGTSQTLSGDFNLNDNKIKIDGTNKRITINDGTNDRILIGYQSGGF